MNVYHPAVTAPVRLEAQKNAQIGGMRGSADMSVRRRQSRSSCWCAVMQLSHLRQIETKLCGLAPFLLNSKDRRARDRPVCVSEKEPTSLCSESHAVDHMLHTWDVI